MLIDSHNHTVHFSSDASMRIEELINKCNELDINTIAITEHYDFDYPHKDEIMHFNIPDYVSNFPKWRELSKNNNGPELLMGIEIGFQPHLISMIDDIGNQANFDTIILSNHLFNGIDIYYNKECYNLPKEERNRQYIDVMASMCEQCSNFDIVAHYDYINRYNPRINETITYSDCPNEFDRMFRAIITKNKSLEINTRSILSRIKNGADTVMPDENIIRRYIELGGNNFTLGSDSHSPETISVLFKETSDYLKNLGVKRLCYFKNRVPTYIDI